MRGDRNSQFEDLRSGRISGRLTPMATNPDIPTWVAELGAPKVRNPHDLFMTAEDLGLSARYVDFAGGIGWVVIPVPDTDAQLWIGWADPDYVEMDLHTDPDFDMVRHVEDMLNFLPEEDPTMFSVGRGWQFRSDEVTDGWVVMAQVMVPEWCECGSSICGHDDAYHTHEMCISWVSALYGDHWTARAIGNDPEDWSTLLPHFARIAHQHAGASCELRPRREAWRTTPGRNPFAVP